MAVTAHVWVAAHAGIEAEILPEGLHNKSGTGGGAEDTAWVIFFMDDVGGSTVGFRRGEVFSACTVAVIDSFSGHAGEGRKGGAPAVAKEGRELGPTARCAGVRPGHAEDDYFTASQGQRGAGAAGGVPPREAHGDCAGGPRGGR